MDDILLITTGGTVDKVYGTGKGVRDWHFGAPAAIPYLIGETRRYFGDVHWIKSGEKDSLDMVSLDRENVALLCRHASHTKIIITHGTDTMIETASVISDMVPPGRVIVLTGASQPACVKNSDAEFNLGLALATCLMAKPGIYIAMNGVFPAHLCEKRNDGTFGYRES
jgi:L-asparaginase